MMLAVLVTLPHWLASAHATPCSTEGFRDQLERPLGCRYRALLFGVQDYDESSSISSLETPHNDIAYIADLLHDKFAFEIVAALPSPNQADITCLLEEERGPVDGCEALLIYFAGHGTFGDDWNAPSYWFPNDAEKDGNVRAIPSTQIREYVASYPHRHVTVIADSCFAGGMFRSRDVKSREPQFSFSQLHGKGTRWGITSGGEQLVADNGRVPNGRSDEVSIFAYHLGRALEEASGRYVLLDAIFPDVRERVALQSRQVPLQDSLPGHKGGQMVLVNMNADDIPLDQEEPSPPVHVNPRIAKPWSGYVEIVGWYEGAFATTVNLEYRFGLRSDRLRFAVSAGVGAGLVYEPFVRSSNVGARFMLHSTYGRGPHVAEIAVGGGPLSTISDGEPTPFLAPSAFAGYRLDTPGLVFRAGLGLSTSAFGGVLSLGFRARTREPTE